MVMLDVPRNPTARILVNGEALPEYNDPDEFQTADVAVKYIEAVSGADFTVQCAVRPDSRAVQLIVHIDGEERESRLAKAEGHALGHLLQGEISGSTAMKNGKEYLSRFFFEELNIVEDSDSTTSDALGEITVFFFYVVSVESSEDPTPCDLVDTHLDEVSEKTLKGRGVSHQTALRSPVCIRRIRPNRQRWETEPLDPDNAGPFASITFKYRPKEYLELSSIKPRTPNPENAQGEDTKPALDSTPSNEGNVKVERVVKREVSESSREEFEEVRETRSRKRQRELEQDATPAREFDGPRRSERIARRPTRPTYSTTVGANSCVTIHLDA